MHIINEISNLRLQIDALRKNGQPIALVPTMGALHDGHVTLIREAQKITDNVIVSIFVNPAQFNQKDDLQNYPRTLVQDSEKLSAIQVPLVWAPAVSAIYPKGFSTSMAISGLDQNLCGATRPGHFDGVILIVAKLFNQTGADIAFFGEKDYQQLAIIRQMAHDLDFDIDIRGVPTVRNENGLALSSRNALLTDQQYSDAHALPRALQNAANSIKNGQNIDSAIAKARETILNAGFKNIDYLDLVDAKTLNILKKWNGEEARLLVAAFIGTIRLIDNISIK